MIERHGNNMATSQKMLPKEYIRIRGANEHNLQNLSVDIPRNEFVVLTGLSGSGKSTIAVELEKMLNDAKKAVYLLDGDNIRHGINSDLEFTDKDRDENIRRIGEISALFCDAGVITLAAFISPFRKMRRFARGRVGENQFLEVYVSTDFETCCKRDPKGLYKKNIKNFTGKDSGYEKPENPEIVLDTIHFTPQECAKVVYQEILKRIN